MRLDFRDFHKGLHELGKKYPQAIRRALKRAGTSGRAEMAKLISKDTGLPSGKVKDEIRMESPSDTTVVLVLVGKRIPLIQFGARGPEPSRGRGRGVSYRLPGGRGRVSNGFIATMPTGHRGVFVRRGDAKRLPIVELMGPSLVRVFQRFLPQGESAAQESMTKNLRSEINFAMSRR